VTVGGPARRIQPTVRCQLRRRSHRKNIPHQFIAR
jgi:hypothetical protein